MTFPEDIDWSFTPSGDPEFVWQFNRHRYFICLGQAWRLTGDEKYVKGFLRLINDWIGPGALNEKPEPDLAHAGNRAAGRDVDEGHPLF